MHYFTKHLEYINEGYFEHMSHALRFTLQLAAGAMACLVHAIFPFLCEKTGSNIIRKLNHDMVTHRDQLSRRKIPGTEAA